MERYEKYKPSGIEWIGEVPEHWKKCRFKNFLTLVTKPSESSIKIGLENIEGQTGRFIPTDSDFEGNGTEFKVGDIVYGKLRPYLQKVWLAEFDGNAVGDFFVFRNRENCNAHYLKYLLLSDGYTKEANSATEGAKMPRVPSDFILSLRYYLPLVSEQEAIAVYLDARCADIDKVVATQEKRIALLKELKQSVITQAVTSGLNPDVKMKDSGVEWIGEVPEHWEIRKIKDCCKDEKYSLKTGPFGTQLKGEDLKDDGPVRVYNQRNVIDNDFKTTNYFVSEEKADQLSGFYTKPFDLLVTSRGTIGRCAILPKDAPMGLLHPCLIAMRINQNICRLDWLKLYINETNCFTTEVKINSNATTIDVIYTDTLKNIFVPIPSVKEQEVILKHLGIRCVEIDKQIETVTKQLDLLREYKQSLITEVVTGKRKIVS